MANLTTVSDIVSDVLFRAGENPNDSTGRFYPKALEYVNRANINLHMGVCPLEPDNQVDFRWAIASSPIILILNSKYETGTISVTENSNSASISTAPAISLQGYHLMVTGAADIFRINQHTAGNTTMTLDSVYTGSTNAASTYKAIPLEYTIGSSSVLRIASPMRSYRNERSFRDFKIRGLDPDKFDTYFPIRDIQEGFPTHFKVVKESDDSIYIQFNAFLPSGFARVEVPYLDIPSDLTIGGNNPRCPRGHRPVIADLALALLQTDKSDSRAQNSFQLAKAGFMAMSNDEKYKWSDMDDTYAQIAPFMDEMDADNVGVLKTESGLVIG